jgi:predicted nuclease of predicted toxin-antitoxin system
LKVLLDEHYANEIAAELRAAGHDAVTVSERGLNGTDDESLLALANSDDRALLTNNARHFALRSSLAGQLPERTTVGCCSRRTAACLAARAASATTSESCKGSWTPTSVHVGSRTDVGFKPGDAVRAEAIGPGRVVLSARMRCLTSSAEP